MDQIVEIVKVSRPGFWPTHFWFYLLPFAGRNMFGSIEFWLGAIYICFPLGLLLYGWNDIGDTETDQVNPRKDSWLFGARPNAALRAKLPLLIVVVQLPFLVGFVWLGGGKMLGWFAVMCLVNLSYNNFALKNMAVLDLLNQAGYLLIFVLGCWLCDVPQLHWPVLTFAALFAMQSHLFGQLMDVDQDRIAGRHSTAIRLGVVKSKLLLTLIMFAEALIAFTYFRGLFVAVFMLAGGSFFMLDAFLGPRRYPTVFAKAFFIGWNVVVFATMYFVWRYDVFLVVTQVD